MQIVDTARALARDVHVQQRMFELLGAWSVEADDPELARAFAVLARHLGDHAQWLAALQPVLHDVEVTPAEAPFLAVLTAITADGRKAAVAAALADLVAGYEARIASASDATDGPVTRVLRLVVTDLRADLSSLTT
jgi:hypothetical protein